MYFSTPCSCTHQAPPPPQHSRYNCFKKEISCIIYHHLLLLFLPFQGMFSNIACPSKSAIFFKSVSKNILNKLVIFISYLIIVVVILCQFFVWSEIIVVMSPIKSSSCCLYRNPASQKNSLPYRKSAFKPIFFPKTIGSIFYRPSKTTCCFLCGNNYKYHLLLCFNPLTSWSE
jgi:hypothetical protein